MTSIDTSIQCCGINEIVNIYENRHNPQRTIQTVCKEMYENEEKQAFLIFSDIDRKIAGKKLSKFITKNKLGKITSSPIRTNPNSHNSLQMWIWAINKSNLKKYYNKHYKQYRTNNIYG